MVNLRLCSAKFKMACNSDGVWFQALSGEGGLDLIDLGATFPGTR